MASLAAVAAGDKKAKNVAILNVRDLSSVTDYFVVCSAGSPIQTRAIADHVEAEIDRQAVKKHHIEGYAGGKWILLDYGDVVVHVFHEHEREFYNLERLWGDAEVVVR